MLLVFEVYQNQLCQKLRMFWEQAHVRIEESNRRKVDAAVYVRRAQIISKKEGESRVSDDQSFHDFIQDFFYANRWSMLPSR